MAGLRVPLSTLRLRPYGRRRMTRGQDDWLGLSCTTLAFVTLCRFSTAHYPLVDPHRGRVPAALGLHAAEARAQGVQARPQGGGPMAGEDLSGDREASDEG